MNDCPCLHCLEREIGCHSTCDLYNAWAQDLKSVGEARVRDQQYNKYTTEVISKMEKAKHNHRK